MRIEKLINCFEPLQKLRARMWSRFTCLTGLSPYLFHITDRSNTVLLIGSFWCQFLYCFQLIYVKMILVAELSPFGKELLIQFTICSLCIMSMRKRGLRWPASSERWSLDSSSV